MSNLAAQKAKEQAARESIKIVMSTTPTTCEAVGAEKQASPQFLAIDDALAYVDTRFNGDIQSFFKQLAVEREEQSSQKARAYDQELFSALARR